LKKANGPEAQKSNEKWHNPPSVPGSALYHCGNAGCSGKEACWPLKKTNSHE